MEGSNPFGGLFGDPDDLQRRLGEFAEQMQGAQRVAWADNAIKLAVDMTVAAIHAIELSGSAEDQVSERSGSVALSPGSGSGGGCSPLRWSSRPRRITLRKSVVPTM